MNSNYDKLKKVLKEVFQLDQADLDFGIYRIMNQKRNEINDFLDNRLLPQVAEILQNNGNGSNTKVQQELDKAIEQANSLGVDPETLPKVIELRKKLNSTISVDTLEQEVYSHLANFFKRYYKDGDFVSLRRYKKDVYAIPYEGEEVKLHWANHDQYYIKTSEYLKNYSFKLSNGKSIKFELIEASTEQNNNKEQSGKERLFQLSSEFPIEVSEDKTEMIVNFTYEPHDKKLKQNKLIDDALGILIDSIPQDFHAVLEKRPTEKNKNRTLLEKHILDFTARNSFDYFIHKDLGGFLSRELDFYIKNEVLYLDDINTESEQDFTSQLSKVNAIKQVALKIITFLAQLENFQKKLWLKKKFVVSTNYCITLDRIPEKYYDDIVKNEEQIKEWKKLFKIDQIKGDLLTINYTEPLTVEFLKSQPYLILDTKFFNESFIADLLSEFDNLEEQSSGLLINSENYQALNLLVDKYGKSINCIYTDPPYNTNASKILYKNNYEHSSWLSLMDNRIRASKHLLKEDGSFSIAIDDFEGQKLSLLLDEIFGFENRLGNVTLVQNPGGRHDDKFIATTHEYLLFYGLDISKTSTNLLPLEEKDIASFKHEDEFGKYRTRDFRRSGSNSTREARPLMFYPIFIDNNQQLEFPKDEELDNIYDKKTNKFNDEYLQELIQEKSKEGKSTLLPIDPKNIYRVWRWAPNSAQSRLNDLLVEKKGSNYVIKTKDRLDNKGGLKPKSTWKESKYASALGTNLLKDILGSAGLFSYPKALSSVQDALLIQSKDDGLILDYFAGSGTTGQAVIDLNRNQKTSRKFILVEMGGYFDKVTKPRILKTTYSSNWKDGWPQDYNGISSIYKYQDFESYEDVLNNLSLSQNTSQEVLLNESHLKDEYMLSYMLDIESRDNLLNLDIFKNPFNYKLNITRNNESVETVIDLVETFNYLIGLHVKTIQTIKGFKVITGVTNERDEETLIIWRNTEEKSNQDLNTFFTKAEFSSRDSEFQRIYVNGDNHLENLKTGDDKWKVVLIEEEFKKRMFDVQDV